MCVMSADQPETGAVIADDDVANADYDCVQNLVAVPVNCEDSTADDELYGVEVDVRVSTRRAHG